MVPCLDKGGCVDTVEEEVLLAVLLRGLLCAAEREIGDVDLFGVVTAVGVAVAALPARIACYVPMLKN